MKPTESYETNKRNHNMILIEHEVVVWVVFEDFQEEVDFEDSVDLDEETEDLK